MDTSLPYPYLNILVYPTTACNLRCKYCFHAQSGYKSETMTIETMEKMFSMFFPRYEYLQFIWHGGEPLCAGLPFFEKAVTIQKKYIEEYGTQVDNGLMTNGTLVDEATAHFFSQNKFDVGVSFDGINNERLRGNTEKVKKGIDILNKHSCEPDIVTVITRENVLQQIENYEYIKKFQSEIKFNPVAPIGGGETNQACDLDTDVYIEKCCDMFDYWLRDREAPVMLEPYFYYLRDIKENTSSGCQRTSCLGRWIAIHPNGDIYPCVRENRKEFCFGNIWSINDVSQIWQSEAFLYMLNGSIERRKKCGGCEWYSFCQGGCAVNAMTENGIQENSGFSCVTFKAIFSYVYKRYEELMKTPREIVKREINPIVYKLLFE